MEARRNKRALFFPVLALAGLLALVSHCGSVNVTDLNSGDFDPDNAPDCTGVAAEFSADVAPIFSQDFDGQTCSQSECHTGGSPAGNLNLDVDDTSSDAVFQAATSAGRIDTGKPQNSKLLLKPLNQPSHTGGNLLGSVDSTQYLTLYCWISAGADNN